MAEHGFEQRARTGTYLPVVAKNALLGLVTLTLYRFWGRTELRRRLWATTYFGGDPLEYTGSGWELFLGFLCSIPVFFVPSIAIFYVSQFFFSPDVVGLLVVGFYVVSVPLVNIAAYLMRRFQLSRTRWRGVRFSLGGSPIFYGLSSSWWTVLQFVTLGWYTPAARMRRAKLLWENARFGDTPFEFGFGEKKLAEGLYGPFALAWIGVPTAFIAAYLMTVIVFLAGMGISAPFMFTEGAKQDPTTAFALGLSIVIAVVFFLLSFVLLAAFVQMPYQAAVMNRIASLLSFDGARFKLKVTTGGLFGVTLAQTLVTVFSLGLFSPLGAMWRIRYVLNRLVLDGEPNFAAIGQSTARAPRQGEGFADAFDIDVGIGLI